MIEILKYLRGLLGPNAFINYVPIEEMNGTQLMVEIAENSEETVETCFNHLTTKTCNIYLYSDEFNNDEMNYNKLQEIYDIVESIGQVNLTKYRIINTFNISYGNLVGFDAKNNNVYKLTFDFNYEERV